MTSMFKNFNASSKISKFRALHGGSATLFLALPRPLPRPLVLASYIHAACGEGRCHHDHRRHPISRPGDDKERSHTARQLPRTRCSSRLPLPRESVTSEAPSSGHRGRFSSMPNKRSLHKLQERRDRFARQTDARQRDWLALSAIRKERNCCGTYANEGKGGTASHVRARAALQPKSRSMKLTVFKRGTRISLSGMRRSKRKHNVTL